MRTCVSFRCSAAFGGPRSASRPRRPVPSSLQQALSIWSALRPGTFAGTGVIITGGGTGLGRAIAVEFARLGADVAILSRKAEHLRDGLAALKEFPGTAFACPCDIRDPEQIAEAFRAAETALGQPRGSW